MNKGIHRVAGDQHGSRHPDMFFWITYPSSSGPKNQPRRSALRTDGTSGSLGPRSCQNLRRSGRQSAPRPGRAAGPPPKKSRSQKANSMINRTIKRLRTAILISGKPHEADTAIRDRYFPASACPLFPAAQMHRGLPGHCFSPKKRPGRVFRDCDTGNAWLTHLRDHPPEQDTLRRPAPGVPALSCPRFVIEFEMINTAGQILAIKYILLKHD